MPMLSEIKKYSDTVCDQIRWRKARTVVATEIENHIFDQRDAYIAIGDDEKTATDKAILQMGDAILVGAELDKTHRPEPQWSLIGLTGILMLIGMLTNYAIDTSQVSFVNFSVVPYFIAACIFLTCYYADFTVLGKHAIKFYAAVLIMSLLAVLIGTEINGIRLWYPGGLLPPLPYLSLFFPLAFALLVYSVRNKGYKSILFISLGFLPLAAILTVIPTVAGLLLFIPSASVLLCFSIAKGWFGVNRKTGVYLVPGFAFAISVLAVIFVVQNDPYAGRQGAGYIGRMIKDILSESVFFGRGGFPQTIMDIAQLPAIGTDYFLIYLIYRFGFVILIGLTVFITLFAALGIYKTLKQSSILGSLIALSILLTFIFQSIFFIVNSLGCVLDSSLSLPFVSYGKSALFMNAALTGFMLSVFRTGDIYKDIDSWNQIVIGKS